MKLLITGGCGFLGSNLAAEALRRGDEVIIFDNLSRIGATENQDWLRSQGEFRFVHADIRNQNDITRIIKETKPDTIFHLAGQVAMTTSIADPRKDFEINVVGSHNLLEAVRDFSPETAVLYSSTNKVYGDLEQFTYTETDTRYVCDQHPNVFDEKITLDFHSPYGCSKGAADQYMLDYARIFGLKTVVFRHSSMYGGHQFTSEAFTGVLLRKSIAISMDGRGRALDNIFVERLWRSVKHEDVYLKGYGTLPELLLGLTEYFVFYNTERTHQSLGYDTPDQVYRTGSGGGARIVDKFSATKKSLLEIEAKNRASADQLHETGDPLKLDTLLS